VRGLEIRLKSGGGGVEAVLEAYFVGRPSPFKKFFSKYAHFLIRKILPQNISYTTKFNLYQWYDK
jgi:hypothetical protein